MTGIMTAAGSLLAISAALPATPNEAGFAALTFTNIGMVDKIGPMGATYGQTTFQPLVGPEITIKGGAKYGVINPSYAVDSEDAGQALMKTASDDQIANFSFRLTRPDGAIKYWEGKVFGVPEDIGTAEAVIMANPVVAINTKPVEVEAP
jgi:hypothetical protein